MKFSQILQEWKERVGWTDQQIADAMVPKVSRAAVNQWINDVHPPDLSNLPALGKLLNRDWVELAAIILGQEAHRGALTENQARLLAETADMDDEEHRELMALIEILYKRKRKPPKKKPEDKPDKN